MSKLLLLFLVIFLPFMLCAVVAAAEVFLLLFAFVVFVGVLLLFLSHPWALGGTGSWGLACAVFPVFCQESAWRSSFSLTSLVALHTDTS